MPTMASKEIKFCRTSPSPNYGPINILWRCAFLYLSKVHDVFFYRVMESLVTTLPKNKTKTTTTTTRTATTITTTTTKSQQNNTNTADKKQQ